MNDSKPTPTEFEIHFTLPYLGEVTPEVVEALSNLAEVMLVQAEDGLYRLGSKEADDVEACVLNGVEYAAVENDFLGDFGSEQRYTIRKVG